MATAATLASPAFGQQDLDERRAPIRIEVTGSYVPRADVEIALPAQVACEEEMSRNRWTTAAKLMEYVSANFNGFNGFNDELSMSPSAHARRKPPSVRRAPARTGRGMTARAVLPASPHATVVAEIRSLQPSHFALAVGLAFTTKVLLAVMCMPLALCSEPGSREGLAMPFLTGLLATLCLMAAAVFIDRRGRVLSPDGYNRGASRPERSKRALLSKPHRRSAMRGAARPAAAMLASMISCVGESAAQEPAELSPNEAIRVEVTGSRIARVDAESALPVHTITREDIDRGGWTTASELLAHVAANFNGMTPAMSIGTAGNPGMSSANLRGIGDGNTLVLLNGRRLSNYAFLSGAPNIDAIPMSVVERVEILTDGASSLYGTDAIAGVVNFITRKDYRGVEVTGFADITERGGGNVYQASFAAGGGDLAKDRFNVFATLDWHKETSIAARDRPYAATGYRPDEGLNNVSAAAIPANIIPDGRGPWLNPGFASGCLPPASTPAREFSFGSGQLCLFDPWSVSTIAPEVERWTAFARPTWQIAPGHQLFAEYLYSRTRMTLEFTPTPAASFATIDGTPVLYPANGPYYPTEYAAQHGISGPLDIAFRTLPLGARTDVVTTEVYKLVIGAQGTVGAWTYGAGYNHSENRAKDEYTNGYVLTSRLVPAMATGLINPFGDSAQAGRDLLASTQFKGLVRSAKGAVDQVDVQLSRDWAPLSGGPLASAFGAEWRREKLDDQPAPILDTGDIIGAPFEISPQSAARRVAAVFAEASVPFAKGWELLASVRHDHYGDFGGTTNPKVALRWQPARSLLMRASWGTGFRAPTLPDLYTQQFTASSFGLVDPVRCPVTRNPEDCGFGEFVTVYGGNPDLKPETSNQVTAGVVWEPLAGFSIAVDGWSIEKEDVIAALAPGDVLAHYEVYGASNVVRGPPDPAYPTLPRPIQSILAYNQNLGNVSTSGVDVALRARTSTEAFGRWTFALDGTYVHEFTARLPGLDAENIAGRYGPYGAVPRWRHYAEVGWQYGAWRAALANSYQSGVTDALPNGQGELRRVVSYSLWDVQATWTGRRNASVALGVRNLFDTDPPFTNSNGNGIDPAYAQTRGRSWYVRLSYALR
jgi:iron complex outermembrane receptor protein